MSEEKLKKAIGDKKLRCPKCKAPVERYEKFLELCASVWDGAGDSGVETEGSKATLVCACGWSERTEYWESYIDG
ncbi:MAG: hypothetical protein K8F91_21950 [Candidatus Obscuribacterales bacterium]|nr:hypothetical protein [Candidatus Obscuribacterales bacterium]